MNLVFNFEFSKYYLNEFRCIKKGLRDSQINFLTLLKNILPENQELSTYQISQEMVIFRNLLDKLRRMRRYRLLRSRTVRDGALRYHLWSWTPQGYDLMKCLDKSKQL